MENKQATAKKIGLIGCIATGIGCVLLAREFLVPCPPLLMTLALASFWLWLALLSIHWPR